MKPTPDDIDQPAADMAVRRVTRRRNPWPVTRAADEAARVAELHGHDGPATGAEVIRRLDTLRSLAAGDAAKRATDRRRIIDRWPTLRAYRVLVDGRKSRVFYCRTDDRAAELGARMIRRRSGQVVRLLEDGAEHLVCITPHNNRKGPR